MSDEVIDLITYIRRYGLTLVTQWARNAAEKYEKRRAKKLTRCSNPVDDLLRTLTPEQLTELRRKIVNR